MARRTITLKGVPYIDEDGSAAVAITPGMLVDGVASISLQGTANAPCRRVALERDELGDDIDTDYAIGDQVKVGSYSPGMRVYGWVASGQTITADDYLGAAGDGTYKAWSSGPYIGRALEAVTAVALTRIRVEIY
jgi:hypothetical protein